MPQGKVIVYNKVHDQLDHEIEAHIHGLGLGDNLKVCRSLPELRNSMEEEAGLLPMAVLVPSDREDLEGLIAMHLDYWQTKIILVLRENDPAAMARAHALHPRFLTVADGDLTEVAMVARNLARANQYRSYH